MNSHFRGAMLTSFLDLISCGLGAAILLFLIVVASPASINDQRNPNSLVVWGKIVSGPKAEIAIEFRTPNNPSWQREHINDMEGLAFSVPSDVDQGGSAMLWLFAPESGEYEFRIVLINYPFDRTSDESTKVAIDFEGQSFTVVQNAEPAILSIPSEESPIYRIRL